MIKKILLTVCLLVGLCFGYSPTIQSFNSGQVSPLMEARSDYPKYQSSSRLLENFLVTAQGPVTRRSGTRFVAEVKDSNYSVRLIPFEYSVDDTYIIEVGNKYMRFYRNGGQILDSNTNAIYEIVTPYTNTDLNNIHYAQNESAMYLVDGNRPLYILQRYDHADWNIKEANIINGPFLPENTTETTIDPNGTTGRIKLTASVGDANIFKPSHVGSIWQISEKLATTVLNGEFTDPGGTSAKSSEFTGGYSFTTSSGVNPWDGIAHLERSTDNGSTWEDALSPLDSTNFNNPAETEPDYAVYRVKLVGQTTGRFRYVFTIKDKYKKGVVKIVNYVNPAVVWADVKIVLANHASTKKWREGYWSDFRGWFKSVEFHQQRLCLAGSKKHPQTIWFGELDPDNYLDFSEGILDTDSFTAALQGHNPIQWLLSQDFLFVGTSGSVGKYGDSGKKISPTSPSYREQTKIGSSNIQAVLAGDSQIYIERNNKKVRGFDYILQYDKYDSPDFTILAENIAESGIKDIAVQTRPDIILWCVLNDGNLATLTYQREQEIMAWSKQSTQGQFESVARIPGASEDEVWVEVRRTNGRFIEQFQSRDWGSDQNNCWFVDSGLSYSGAAKDTFGGLSHLEGDNVSVYGDGIVLSDETIIDGNIIVDNEASKVIAGLSYTSKLETLPIVFESPQGNTTAMNTHIVNLYFDFYKTGYCKYSGGINDDLTAINFYTGATLSAWKPLYTSKVAPFGPVKLVGGSKKKQTIYVESSAPLPLTIRSITSNLQVIP